MEIILESRNGDENGLSEEKINKLGTVNSSLDVTFATATTIEGQRLLLCVVGAFPFLLPLSLLLDIRSK